MGYWSTIGIILWGFGVGIGPLFFAPVYGFLGVFEWLGSNFLLASRLNSARTHWRSDAFDDRLTGARVHGAEEDLMNRWKKKRSR